MGQITDRTGFILHHTRLLPVPHAPSIKLHLADEAVELWQKTEDELGEMGLPPPFWAFAWAGGQGLARHLLDNPHLVAGKRVLDFASGSGLVAIAASIAGAAHVEASEIDGFACAAMPLNAAANGVTVMVREGDLIGRDDGWDVIMAGDVFYERGMAEAVFGWLQELAKRGALVLIGDPSRAYLPKAGLKQLGVYTVPVTRALEDAEIKQVIVCQVLPITVDDSMSADDSGQATQ
ncbi:MAG: class I SAM-dependent methyltransferase [Bosea sp. (in: a-proteobacteria)]